MHLSLLPRFLAALLTLSVLAPGQRGGGEEEQAERERMRQAAKAERAQKGGAEKEEPSEEEQKRMAEFERLTPEERLARNIISGASSLCRFHVAMKPARLLPGQSGTLLITATLQGSAVIPSPAPVELMSPAQQGLVHFGALVVRPADLGSQLAPGYIGRPVYDNYAIFELPVSLAGDAQIGKKYPVVVDIKFDLYDGNNAQPLGRFLDRATAEIEAGAVVDPIVSMPTKSSEPIAPTPVSGVAEAIKPASAPAPQPSSLSGSQGKPLESPAVPTAPVSSGEATLPPVDDGDGGLPILPIAIGGALLLGVVLLLVRRR